MWDFPGMGVSVTPRHVTGTGQGGNATGSERDGNDHNDRSVIHMKVVFFILEIMVVNTQHGQEGGGGVLPGLGRNRIVFILPGLKRDRNIFGGMGQE